MTKTTAPATAKNRVHLVLQGKGGVGKSLVANLLSQYFMDKNTPLFCVDTDPVNHTLAAYKSLPVHTMEVQAEDDTIDPRRFDVLVEAILENDKNVVIDTGASTFLPFCAYLVENSVIEMLADADREVFVHSIVVGDESLDETVKGLTAIVRSFPEQARIVAWLNEFFGPVEKVEDDLAPAGAAIDKLGAASHKPKARSFEEFKVYPELAQRLHGIVRLYRQNAATFGQDLANLKTQKLLLSEALERPDWTIMSKQRLKTFRKMVFEQLDAVL